MRALTDDEENTLFITGQFGDSSPSALQRTMWWFLSMHFGFRAKDESRKLRWGEVGIVKCWFGLPNEERKPAQDKSKVTKEHFNRSCMLQTQIDARYNFTKSFEATVLWK